MLLRNSLAPIRAFGYGAFTLSGLLFHAILLTFMIRVIGLLQPRCDKSHRFGLIRFRSPLLTESHSLSFPPLTEMFHFSGFALPGLFYSAWSGGLLDRRVSPFGNLRLSLLAASRSLSQLCHVLHRLLSPRHPLTALNNLIL